MGWIITTRKVKVDAFPKLAVKETKLQDIWQRKAVSIRNCRWNYLSARNNVKRQLIVNLTSLKKIIQMNLKKKAFAIFGRYQWYQVILKIPFLLAFLSKIKPNSKCQVNHTFDALQHKNKVNLMYLMLLVSQSMHNLSGGARFL